MTSSVSQHTPYPFFLDTEPYGVQKKGEPAPCLRQISLIDPYAKEKVDRAFEAYIKPIKGLEGKREELNFTHGNIQAPVYSLKKVWPELKKWVDKRLEGKRFAVIVAHNSYDYDWPLLKQNLSRIGQAIPRHWKPYDSLWLTQTLKIPGSHALTDICRTLKVKVKRAHTAYYDALMLKKVFYKMIGGADLEKTYKAMVSDHPYREVAALVRNPKHDRQVSAKNKTHEQAMKIFWDTETTGLFPKKGEKGDNPRVVEFAGFNPETGHSFETYVNPGCHIPKESTDVHHITDRDVRSADDYKVAWTKFEDWMDGELKLTGKKIICIVGHNIYQYDLKVHDAECDRVGLEKKRWKGVDTWFLSMHLFKGLKGISHKMQDLREMMGIAEDHAHRALGDVRVNSKVFDVFTKGVDKLKLDAAILSDHPILNAGQVIRDTGKFNPKAWIPQGAGKRGAAAIEKPKDKPMDMKDYFVPLSSSSSSRSSRKDPRLMDIEEEENISDSDDFLKDPSWNVKTKKHARKPSLPSSSSSSIRPNKRARIIDREEDKDLTDSDDFLGDPPWIEKSKKYNKKPTLIMSESEDEDFLPGLSSRVQEEESSDSEETIDDFFN